MAITVGFLWAEKAKQTHPKANICPVLPAFSRAQLQNQEVFDFYGRKRGPCFAGISWQLDVEVNEMEIEID